MALTSKHTIRCVNVDLTTSLIMDADGSSNKAHRYANLLMEQGWEIFVVDQGAGRCYYSKRLITIPAWAYKKGAAYTNYYLAHELAHAKAGPKAKHGPEFMAAFKSLCEPENWHYELGYKPQHATKAGIMVIPEDF